MAEVVADRDAAALKAMASALGSSPRVAAALCADARPSTVVIGRSAGVTVDARSVVAQLTARFAGRGGGTQDLAQAGGLDAPPAEIAALARQLLLDACGRQA